MRRGSARARRSNSPSTTNVRILDPNWLTGAIYKVLTAGLVVHQAGVFARAQLAELLDPNEYPADRWEFILGHVGRPRIDILVTGPERQRRAALGVVIADLEAVHRLNPESKPTAKVPLPDNPDLDVGYDDLLTLERLEGPDYKHFPAGGASLYRVGDMLDGVRLHFNPAQAKPRPAAAEPELTDESAERLHALKRDYAGIWGAKVFGLAIVTLGPLFVNFKLFELEVSPATLVYAIYHSLGIFCWASVHRLTGQSSDFSPSERDREITKVTKYARWTGRIGWAVVALLMLTALATVSLVFGATELRAPLPQFVYDVLGVKETG